VFCFGLEQNQRSFDDSRSGRPGSPDRLILWIHFLNSHDSSFRECDCYRFAPAGVCTCRFFYTLPLYAEHRRWCLSGAMSRNEREGRMQLLPFKQAAKWITSCVSFFSSLACIFFGAPFVRVYILTAMSLHETFWKDPLLRNYRMRIAFFHVRA